MTAVETTGLQSSEPVLIAVTKCRSVVVSYASGNAQPIGRADTPRHGTHGLHFILGHARHAASCRSPQTLGRTVQGNGTLTRNSPSEAIILYVEPRYPVEEVNQAGRSLVAPDETFDVGRIYDIVSNWRASHHRPLNTFYMALKSRAESIDPNAIASQRIKRLESITAKLKIQPKMKLSQMQDIGGCRAVMPTVAKVRALHTRYVGSDDYHVLKSGKDYIAEPKPTGYRGIHLIYRYARRKPCSHDGLQVEIQLRTQQQHVWATAVEAAGTFTNQALKSNQGSSDWRRFFALVSSVYAEQERCPIVPGTPTSKIERSDEIGHLANKLHVVNVLQAYGATLNAFTELPRMKYYLIELDPVALKVDVVPFPAAKMEEANRRYTELERQAADGGGQRQVVLVSVESIQALRQAYPNYFLDTSRFVQSIRQITGLPEGAA